MLWLLWHALTILGNERERFYRDVWLVLKNCKPQWLSYLSFNMFQHSASNRVTHRIQPLEHRAEATVRAVDFSIAWPRKQSSKCMARMSCLRHMDMNPEVSWSIWQKNCHTHRLQCGEKLFCSMCRLLLCICMSWSFSQLFVIWNSEARPATECHLSTSIPKVTLSFCCERISFWNKHPGTFRLDFQLLCLRVIRNTANAEDGPLYVHVPCSSRFYIDCAACCMASISDISKFHGIQG